MAESPTTQTLEDLLSRSQASETFKAAVKALEADRPQDRIQFNPGAPKVKVLRVIMKLIEARPEMTLESIDLQAVSGCSNFTGNAVVQPGDIEIDFNWDCAWRAKQEGWTDAFGDPDQIRAAREFGYQCFEKFEIKD